MTDSGKLTLEQAKRLLAVSTTEEHLLKHALAVSSAMGAMAGHFGADADHWRAVGYLHDYDYQLHPDEHLKHTERELLAEGVDAVSVRAVLAHGWGACTDVVPESDLEKSLYAVDELTGLISANARMRPTGIHGLEPSSVKKKMKDKKFAAKINRSVIVKGAEMLGMDISELISLCVKGMTPHARELDIAGAEGE